MTLGHEKLDVYRLPIGYGVREEPAVYGSAEIDFDPDSDFDLDDKEPQKHYCQKFYEKYENGKGS